MDEWVQLEQMDLSTVEVELPDPDPKRCVQTTIKLHPSVHTTIDCKKDKHR